MSKLHFLYNLRKKLFCKVSFVTFILLIIALTLTVLLVSFNYPQQTQAQGSSRDPLNWPFASDSIWNMPIGSNAVYVAANWDPNPANYAWPTIPQAGEELMMLQPNSPLTDVYYSNAGWTGENRCTWTTPQTLLTRINIPSDFIIPDLIDGTHLDNALTVLNNDGRTIQQFSAFARCTAGGYATAIAKFDDVDIYGDGIYGSRGSGLSAFGGSIRVGELRPGQIGMRHALKMGVFAKAHFYKCTQAADCYRWPARWADGYAVGNYGTLTNNQNTALKMGALMAIPSGVNIDSLSLQTEPAKQLAWTLQNYGAYIVDSDPSDPNTGFMVENKPNSKLAEFYNDYGYNFRQNGYRGSTDPAYNWQQDIIKLIKALYVVDNNSPTSIGGGGTPLQPIAPPFTSSSPLPTLSPTPTPTPTPPPRADLNNDGVVNDFDAKIMFSSWGKTDKPVADVDKDGKVNSADYAVLLSEWQ